MISMGFLAKVNTLRIVYSMETNADNWLHHSFVANDASFGTFALSEVILFGLSMYRYLQQILFLFYQPSVEAISCVQKWKKHFKTWLRQVYSHECATIICLYTHSEKIKTNRPRAFHICIGVIIYLSIQIHVIIRCVIQILLCQTYMYLLFSDNWSACGSPLTACNKKGLQVKFTDEDQLS